MFLTYAQVNDELSSRQLLDFITGSARRKPGFCLVGRERHADGGTHFHVFVDWVKRFSFTNERRFDWAGHHPNISPVNSPAACLEYCSKDNDTLEFGTRPDFNEAERKESRNELWGRLLDEATSPSDFLQRVRENAPYDFAVRYQQLDTMARTVFQRRPEYESEYAHEDFDLPDAVDQWMAQEFDQEVCLLAFSVPVGHHDLLCLGPPYSGGPSNSVRNC